MHEIVFPLPPEAVPGSLARLLDAPSELIEMLPVAAYACDAAGRVLWFNKRAVELWGRAPRIGDDAELFCGSFKLYSAAGRYLAANRPDGAGVGERRGRPRH